MFTNLYSYFGTLLGCSQIADDSVFPSYSGDISMYNAHKYMAINNMKMQFYISQFGLAAASFGVTPADVSSFQTIMQGKFGDRCAPPISIPNKAAPALQSICLAGDCPDSPGATCGAYDQLLAVTYQNGTGVDPVVPKGQASILTAIPTLSISIAPTTQTTQTTKTTSPKSSATAGASRSANVHFMLDGVSKPTIFGIAIGLWLALVL
jgi:hypothetical protein